MYVHAKGNLGGGGQSGERLWIPPGLPTHLVQELKAGTVGLLTVSYSHLDILVNSQCVCLVCNFCLFLCINCYSMQRMYILYL